MSASIESGFEAAVVTRSARAWSWVLLVVLLIGAYGAALLDNASVQNLAMRLAAVLLLVGYVIITRRAARASGAPTTAGLPRGVWSAIVAIVVYLVTAAAYAPMNDPLNGSHSMVGHWDQYVPTLPIFVIPYQAMYVVLFASLGYFAYRQLNRQVRTMAAAFAIAMITAELTFVVFQTDVDMVGLDAGNYGGIFGHMLRYINVSYYEGRGFSAFPSMHCAYAVVFAIAWYRRRNAVWSALMIAFAALVIVSTQVLHEHVLMDALYGIVVATAAYAVAWFWLEYRPALKRERESNALAGADGAR